MRRSHTSHIQLNACMAMCRGAIQKHTCVKTSSIARGLDSVPTVLTTCPSSSVNMFADRLMDSYLYTYSMYAYTMLGFKVLQFHVRVTSTVTIILAFYGRHLRVERLAAVLYYLFYALPALTGLCGVG